MTLETYLTYCLAVVVLVLVPGPSVTIVIANSLKYGTKAGLMNVLGTQAGAILWLLIAAFGLTALISLMGVWFDVLRIVGALYLVWLGIKLLRSNGDLGVAKAGKRDPFSLFMQGFVVLMSNPKILVLFGALIPPFLTPGGDTLRETFLLGVTFMLIAGASDTVYAVLSGRAGAWLSRSRVRAVEIISGICLTAGGVWMALKGR